MKLFSCLLVLFIFCSECRADYHPKNSSLEVGVIVPFSGELAFFGKAFQQGIEMAVSEGLTSKLNFSFEDDHSGDREATISALHNLISRQRIQVAILTAMPNAVVADPLAKKENIIAFSAWDSNREMEKLSKNTLGYGWSNERTGQAMAAFAHDSLKADTAAVVTAHDEWSEIMGHAFSETFNSKGGKIVFEDSVGLDDTDFRSLAAKIVRAKPNVVYFPLYRASLLSFARHIKQAGYAGTLLSAEGITNAEVQQLGKLADGMYITSAYLNNSEFQQRYKSKFGTPSEELNLAHVALGHEMAKFLNSCVEELSKKNREISIDGLRDVMSSITVDDALGKVSFQGQKTMERSQVILMAKDGKLSLVEKASH